jgi:hypothetical protein
MAPSVPSSYNPELPVFSQVFSTKSSMAHQFRDSSPQSYKQGARSCRGCHQRKVRRDRGVPCTNCSRCGISCVYPTKATDVERKGPSLQNVSSRLERMEILLSRLIESTSQGTIGSQQLVVVVLVMLAGLGLKFRFTLLRMSMQAELQTSIHPINAPASQHGSYY